jgi:hypothetical protein
LWLRAQEHRQVLATDLACVSALLFTSAGAPLGKCIVKDISERGAKLIYSAAGELPDRLLFTLGLD